MEISVEKLGELQPEDCVICDIRGEHDRAYGFIPGSVGISAEELLTSPPGEREKADNLLRPRRRERRPRGRAV